MIILNPDTIMTTVQTHSCHNINLYTAFVLCSVSAANRFFFALACGKFHEPAINLLHNNANA